MTLAIAVLLAAISIATPAVAQTLTIFGNAVPNNPIDDGGAVTVGVKFWSSQAGTLSGIRFYRAVRSKNGYTAKLYSASGTLLSQVKMVRESGAVPGWQDAIFVQPIPIAANTTYIASYYSPVGRNAWDEYGLANGKVNGPLVAPASSATGGNGIYDYGNVFPRHNYHASNYYVDVLFRPTSRALTISFSPPNPNILSNSPSGTFVANVVPTWSDGSQFTGTISFAAPYSNDGGRFALSGMNPIVNPAGPGLSGDAGTTRNVTIAATQ